LAEDFVADLHDSWKVLGKAAITTVAWTDPSTYLRVVASLIPKDIEVTITNVTLEKMTTRELEALLREAEGSPEDPLESEDGAEILEPVD